MNHSPSRAGAPSAAERVRSILASAHSMTVFSDGRRHEVRWLDGLGSTGQFHLHAPFESAGAASGSRVPVRLELTDIAPTRVRDRVRARVALTGVLSAPYDPDSAESTCVEFGQGVLEDAGGRTYVGLAELEAAELDPVATGEAALLTHLVDGHADLLPELLRLVRPRARGGASRVVPVALDRYGLTLRLEYRRSHRDARVDFPSPVRHVDDIGYQIQALVAARRLSHVGHPLP
ncbi:DUF2470 domain-containing protein [Streptomyces sp. NPDC059070]|uniref:DUF2470 domain-containing protein n=1 Tax=unclassified Streptomyces TaxID=2593676 RepID=UPI0034E28E82